LHSFIETIKARKLLALAEKKMSSSKSEEVAVHSMETEKGLMMPADDVIKDSIVAVEQNAVENNHDRLEIVLESSKEEMVAAERSYLCQEIIKKKIESEEGTNQTIQLSHRRTINDKHYAVTRVTVGGENEENIVETDLSADELQEFEDKWYLLWKPQL
jgi:hypothetical protein